MDTLIFIILIIIIGGIFAWKFYKGKQTENELIQKGEIVKRDVSFFQEKHIFSTKVETINEIGEKMDKSILIGENISFEPHYDNGGIAFQNNTSFGSFLAGIETLGKDENNLFQYSFHIYSWTERRGMIADTDILNANVLLTTIEKAIFSLDSDAKVSRERVTNYKTKPSFF